MKIRRVDYDAYHSDDSTPDVSITLLLQNGDELDITMDEDDTVHLFGVGDISIDSLIAFAKSGGVMTEPRKAIRKELDDLLKQCRSFVSMSNDEGPSPNVSVLEYQEWYTRALAVIRQLIPERLD